MYLINKTLRIMVAHEDQSQRLSIEKHLNTLGYYRVAPVTSFREVVLLSQLPGKAFDLLIVSRALYVAGEQCTFFGDKRTPNIPNILIYEDEQFLTRQGLEVSRGTLQHGRALAV
ncbi:MULTISPECIES: hypothetical protein [unclassified Pseudomonas]|uniref:hypothetical protein n=1 Tax=unclassified Pseudomonas TaxID=196821 RepID=UPI002AC9ACB2|nr:MULTISPECIES: hypothetical protein [unclassified Pseudomonas]MEB0047312.1 hypothetical protein [Pseudomonas sp. Dout3]MEB0096564.1 hypothetical protein [Pseudomonas sp. DC1.2]WPX60315.1 hypothetical protein RHM68_06670 [Pseudomonas sp. DC1.2]